MELLCVYIYRYISLTILSKEVEKLNFRQYGQMKSRAGQRQREEKVQKRKSQKKEDADARKGKESRDSLCFSNDLWFRRVEK